jgi:hypothetical protein
MAGSTIGDNLPYPEDADVPNVPADFLALALATQTALDARDSAIGGLESELDGKILYGPASSPPGSLDPGVIYCGY